jgi:hypothetical protein
MNKLDLTNEQLFDKVEKHELVICHLRHEMPDGYMEYDKKHYRRFFNI